MNDTILKVLVWRLISITITLVMVWSITGSIKLATGITLFLHLVLTIAHYMFEIFWDRLKNEDC